jgi:undecaprenyl pyrophosphate phosphatase UppP
VNLLNQTWTIQRTNKTNPKSLAMKTLLFRPKVLIAALATVALAVLLIKNPEPAHAQAVGFGSITPTYGVPIQIADGLSTMPGGATSNALSTAYIDCRGEQNVGIAVKFSFASATTSNFVYTFDRSIDKTNWDTVNTFVLTVAGNGTTPQVCVTNVNVGGIGWMRLKSLQNTQASIAGTNLGVVYSIKRSAP